VKLNGTVIDSVDQTHTGSSSSLQSWVWRGNIFEANTSTGTNTFTITVGAANTFGGSGDTTPEVQVGTNLVVQEFKRWRPIQYIKIVMVQFLDVLQQ